MKTPPSPWHLIIKEHEQANSKVKMKMDKCYKEGAAANQRSSGFEGCRFETPSRSFHCGISTCDIVLTLSIHMRDASLDSTLALSMKDKLNK